MRPCSTSLPTAPLAAEWAVGDGSLWSSALSSTSGTGSAEVRLVGSVMRAHSAVHQVTRGVTRAYRGLRAFAGALTVEPGCRRGCSTRRSPLGACASGERRGREANWAIDLQGFEDAGTVRGPLVDGYLCG